MIFNKSKSELKYFIDTDIPKGFFPNIEIENTAHKTKCPAVMSMKNRILNILSPIDIEITINKNDTYDYTFSNKYKNNELVHSYIKNNFVIETINNNFKNFQYRTPYTFVSNDDDLEIISIEGNVQVDNMKFITGSFYPGKWIRNINASCYVINTNKVSKINIKEGDVLTKIVLNKSCSLEYIEENNLIKNYKSNISKLLKYKVSIQNNIEDIVRRKPKQLW